MGSCCSSAAAPVDQQTANSHAIDEMLADHSPAGQWRQMGFDPPLGAEDLIPQAKALWLPVQATGLFHHGTGRTPAQVLAAGFSPQYATEYCFVPGHPEQPHGGTGRGANNGKFTFFLPPTYLGDGVTPRSSGAVNMLWGQDGFLYEVYLNNVDGFTKGGAIKHGQEFAVGEDIPAMAIRKIAKKHLGAWTTIWDSTDHTDGGWMPNMRALYGN